MSQDVFKAPKAKRKHGHGNKKDSERWSPKKKRRTKEDFNAFCSIVLEYTQYETLKQEDLRRCNNTSPLDSAGSTADSFTSESTSSSISESEHDDKFLDGTTPQLVASHLSNDENSNSSFSKVEEDDDDDADDSRDDSRGDLGDSPPGPARKDVKGSSRNERREHRSHSDKSDSSGDESGDDDSWELVTCYCMKPFSGRPMIECSECLTWIHLSCAKIRKSNIPDDFVCQKCRESKFTMRKSSRIRSEKKMINA